MGGGGTDAMAGDAPRCWRLVSQSG